MTYSITEELIDAMADYLDSGMIATEVIDRMSEEIDDRDENIIIQDILDGFFEIYLCSPEEYVQNLEDDSDWSELNGLVEIHD